MDPIKRAVINKMKAHDWYYEYGDDHKYFLKGLEERSIIYDLLCQIPAKEIEPLMLEYVPKEVQGSFVRAMTTYFKVMGRIKEEI